MTRSRIKDIRYWALCAGLLWPAACASRQTVRISQTVSAAPTERVESKFAGPKRRIGVVEFDNKTAYGKNRLGGAAADILVTELSKTGKFIIIERDKIGRVLEEQKLGATGAVEANTAADIGKILGLNAVVIGAVSNFGVETTGGDYLLGQSKRQTATAVVDVRVVEAQTGQVLYADSGKGEAKSSTAQVLGMGTRGGYNELIEGDALRAAIAQLVVNIASQINRKAWSCRVADVDRETVYLDAGLLSGLELEQKLAVYHLGREIRSPSTGMAIGRTEEKIAEVKITGFFGEDGAKAALLWGAAPSVGDLVKLENN
ncbi:MAG: hypothetical protein HY611_10320 [Elusimicrobia bacterium]|nr:hypothetical protein [Elusimicrobiota bacterium]